jgi:hypothetical protein
MSSPCLFYFLNKYVVKAPKAYRNRANRPHSFDREIHIITAPIRVLYLPFKPYRRSIGVVSTGHSGDPKQVEKQVFKNFYSENLFGSIGRIDF